MAKVQDGGLEVSEVELYFQTDTHRKVRNTHIHPAMS